MKEYIRQQLYDELEKSLQSGPNLIQVIIGPRQVGKTTLALQLLERWPGATLYETADQPGTPPLSWLETVWQQARALPVTSHPSLLVIDEVQKIPHWSDLVKRLFDEDKRAHRLLRVVLLGSSSLLMQKGLTESLAGRFELHRHYQWSYLECQQAFGLSLSDYLYFGGYPGGLVLKDDPARWARYIRDSLIETVLAKDILLTSPVSKPALLRQTFALACGHPAQILSYQKMIGTLTDAGNVVTIASYVQLLSSAFLILPLERFSGSLIKQRGSIPKLILFDNALIAAMNNLAPADIVKDPTWTGRIIENLVGARIFMAIEPLGGKLLYFRERDIEVDFVVQIGKRLIAIEVKKKNTTESGLTGQHHFLKKYPDAQGLVIGDKSNAESSIPQIGLEDFLLDTAIYLR